MFPNYLSQASGPSHSHVSQRRRDVGHPDVDYCSGNGCPSMTKEEKKRLSAVLRATEYLFLENIALKLVLEHREVPNWQKLVEHLLSDKEMLAGVRLKFRDLYREIEGSSDPSAALEALLGELPAAKKTH
jgi:hypothetical protein